MIQSSELETIAKTGDKTKVYVCILKRQDMYRHKNGKPFDSDVFDAANYESIIHESVLPNSTIFICCGAYKVGEPILISNSQL